MKQIERILREVPLNGATDVIVIDGKAIFVKTEDIQKGQFITIKDTTKDLLVYGIVNTVNPEKSEINFLYAIIDSSLEYKENFNITLRIDDSDNISLATDTVKGYIRNNLKEKHNIIFNNSTKELEFSYDVPKEIGLTVYNKNGSNKYGDAIGIKFAKRNSTLTTYEGNYRIYSSSLKEDLGTFKLKPIEYGNLKSEMTILVSTHSEIDIKELQEQGNYMKTFKYNNKLYAANIIGDIAIRVLEGEILSNYYLFQVYY